VTTVCQFVVSSNETLFDLGRALEASLPRGHGRNIEVWHQGGMSIAFSAAGQGNRVAHRDHRGFVIFSGKPLWKGQSLTASEILDLYENCGAIRKWIEQVDGEFLIAVGEERDRQLTVVRDKGGFVPGYIAGPIDGVWAASTNPLAAAFALRIDEFNEEFMARYVAIRYDEVWGQLQTFLKDVAQLAPASFRNHGGESRYWHFNTLPSEVLNMTDREAEDRFRELLLSSTQDCLDSLTPDSRPGLALSGGIDSSSVATALSMLGRNVTALTVSYPGNKFSSVEETGLARETAESLGHRWSGVAVTSDVFLSAWQDAYDKHTFPLATSAQLGLSLLYAEASRREFTHLFIGGSGDDHFAGNYQHYLYNLADLLVTRSTDFPSEYGQWVRLHSTEEHPKNAGVFWDFLARNIDTSTPGKICPKPQLLEPSLVRYEALNSLILSPTTIISDSYLRALSIYGAWFSMRPPGTLQHHDTSWATTLQILDPFANRSFLEFGWALSPTQKIRLGQNKSLVRRSLVELMPPAVRGQSAKIGFDVPFGAWMNQVNFREFCVDVLEMPSSNFLDRILDLRTVIKMIKDAAYPRLNAMLIWQSVNAALWKSHMHERMLRP